MGAFGIYVFRKQGRLEGDFVTKKLCQAWNYLRATLEKYFCFKEQKSLAFHLQDGLAEWSKALASGASPQGRGFEPHSRHMKYEYLYENTYAANFPRSPL